MERLEMECLEEKLEMESLDDEARVTVPELSSRRTRGDQDITDEGSEAIPLLNMEISDQDVRPNLGICLVFKKALVGLARS